MALCINQMVNLFLIISLIVSICKTQSDSDATSQPTSQPTLSPIPFLSESDCEVSFPSINTSFNLCLLKLPNNGIGDRSYYEVQDYRYSGINEKNETATYLYHFNIGGPVLAEDSQCVITNTTDNPGYCSDIAGEGQCNTALTPINGTSWAYQLRVSNTTSGYIDDCWRLSDETGGPPSWELVYPSNPIEGVKLIYNNGDFLHDGDACTNNRRFTISFLCENEALNVPDEEPVYELYTCDYQIEMKSIYGCPVECPVIGNPPRLCNNEGLCGYDYTNMKPRCFCYDKYEGDYCHIYVPEENVTAPSKPLPTPSPNNVVHTFQETIAIDQPPLNVTYDLTPMGLNGMAYRILDIDGKKPYIYYFGVFQPIDLENDEIPVTCRNLSVTEGRLPCSQIDSTDGSCLDFSTSGRDLDDRTYALQYDPGNGFCAYLGTTYEWNLYDELDSARGITINYQGGSWCGSRGINRGFKISLVCPDDDEEDAAPNINEEAFVEEDTELYCEYSMEIKTTIACPYQCRTSEIVGDDGKIEYEVCSGKGICAADPNAGFVRCLCDDGWTGVECNELDTPQPTKNPTLSPTGVPTVKPTRYPTLGVRVVNITRDIQSLVGDGDNNSGIGGTIIIIILVVVILVIIVIVYFGYKKFKQKEQVMRAELDEYKSMGNEEKHDLTRNKGGAHTFTTIDDHIANDKEEDD